MERQQPVLVPAPAAGGRQVIVLGLGSGGDGIAYSCTPVGGGLYKQQNFACSYSPTGTDSGPSLLGITEEDIRMRLQQLSALRSCSGVCSGSDDSWTLNNEASLSPFLVRCTLQWRGTGTAYGTAAS